MAATPTQPRGQSLSPPAAAQVQAQPESASKTGIGLPRHVAIIMDGNGRWAQKQGLPRIEGHRRGVSSVRRITEHAASLGLEQLTLYCLSSENWRRPQAELSFLMQLLGQYMVEERSLLMRQRIRLAQKDFAWAQRDLRSLSRHAVLYAPLGDLEELVGSAWIHLRESVLPESFSPLTEAGFQKAVEQTRERLRGAVPPLVDRIGHILDLRAQVARRIGGGTAPAPVTKARTLTDLSQLGAAPVKPAATSGLAMELVGLVPARFPERTTAAAMVHLPRYLKALLIRAERATLNPAKEQERIRLITPYVTALGRWESGPPTTEEGRRLVQEFRWMLEEFRVSIFAQELGTAQPVSPKRLDEALERIRVAG